MRKELLPSTEGLRIAMTRTDCTCSYSGDTIPEGDHGLLLRMKNSKNRSEVYSAWVSLQSRLELKQALSNFNFSSHEPRVAISPSEDIAYSKVKGETISCLACGRSMSKGEEGVAFVNNTNRHRSNTAWCHVECIPKVCEGIDAVEKHASDILSRMI